MCVEGDESAAVAVAVAVGGGEAEGEQKQKQFLEEAVDDMRRQRE